MNKAFAPLLVTALMLAVPAHAQDKPAAADKDYVVLKVDGEDIKKSEIDDAWKEAGKYIFQGREVPAFETMAGPIKEKFLREVASEHVLYKVALKEGLENSPDMQAMFEKLKRQAIIGELLKDKTKDSVSDEKLKAAYDAHIKEAVASNGGRDEVHPRYILLKTKEAADAVEKKLKGGASFEKLAKDKSEDKNTASSGGDLGWVDPTKMPQEVTAVLLKLNKGEVSPPLKVDTVWYIVKLEDWRSLPPPPFSDVKDSLKQEVGNKAVGDYVKVVMKDVKITSLDASGHATDIPAVPSEKSEAAPAMGGKDAPADQ
jgi:peptidyl-prolyl cis-trans isomerase C